MLNIGSSLRNIERCLDKTNKDWLKLKLSERHDVTIGETFESIHKNLDLIASILKNNDVSLNVENYQLQEVQIVEFVQSYLKGIRTSEKQNVTTTLNIHPEIEFQLKNKIRVRANRELLEIAFNEILENANRHAFTAKDQKYKMEISINLIHSIDDKEVSIIDSSESFNSVKLEFANNGVPFPLNFGIDKFIRKNSFAGDTGNTGQGGYDLNEIIKYHNKGLSTLKLLTGDNHSEFATRYVFTLPIIF